jgi:hypothetical protein
MKISGAGALEMGAFHCFVLRREELETFPPFLYWAVPMGSSTGRETIIIDTVPYYATLYE